MKNKLQALGYKVITKKVQWSGDVLYILLDPRIDSYLGSFKLSKEGTIYSVDFKGISIYQLKDICEVLVK